MLQNDTGKTEIADRFERLRRILEVEQKHDVTYADAVEVGEALVSFFQVLAESPQE